MQNPKAQTTLFITGLLLLSTASFTQQANERRETPKGSGRVAGRVIAADTGTILRNAKVTLTALEDRYESKWIALTDDDGRFDLRELPPATFTVRIGKAGFVEAAPPNVVLKDKPAQDLGDLKLLRGGVIVGRVIDRYGEPVVDAAVGATHVFFRTPANKGFQLVQSTTTNDLGEFRLYGLQPGSYYVSAGFGMMRVQASGQPNVTFANAGSAPALTFYPGTVRPADAQLVDVRGGEQTFANIPLVSVPLATLSGHVVDSKNQPATNMMVMLSSFGQAGGLIFTAHAFEVDAQGAFVINNLQPGDYQLDVISRAALETFGRSGTIGGVRDNAEAAFLKLSIVGDQKDLVIQTSSGFDVRGRIAIDGGPAPSGWPKLTISGGMYTGSSTIGQDGAFTIRGMDGHRQLSVYGLPAGAVLERIQLHGRDVTDDGFDVNADVDGVDIAITTKLTIVAGKIIDAKGVPAVGDVIVYADNADLWAKSTAWRYVKTAHATVEQGFRLSGLFPGRYLAVAVEQLDEFEWANPVNLEKLRAVAVPIVLAKGETQSVTLTRK